MKLEEYSDKILIALMRNGNPMLNEKIKYILEKRGNEMSYHDIYLKYLSSEDVEREVLAKSLAVHLCNNLHFCEIDVLLDIFNYLEVDYIWALAKGSPNKQIRDLAREKIDEILDEIDKTFIDEEYNNVKIRKRNNIIEMKEKR